MNIPLLIVAIIGVSVIFGIAAWLSPKVIRAIYPEEQHESMIKKQRIMIIIAIIVAVSGFTSGIGPFLCSIGKLSMDTLLTLVGEWQGEGQGEFSTIKFFIYRETTIFTHDGERSQLHFDQHTIRPGTGSEWIQTHRECGFLFWQDDNRVQLCTVHSGGRFEKLKGLVTIENDGWRIDFEHEFLGNDERMVASSRIWRLKKGIFSYEMSMATHTTSKPEMLFHLSEKLEQL